MPKPIRPWTWAAAIPRTSWRCWRAWPSAWRPTLAHVAVEGIQHITPTTSHFASEFGFRIKLLGVARRTASGIDQKVHPAMVRARSPLANVDGAANGVLVDAGEAGSFFFSGRGAGEAPTASAVVADMVEIARGASSRRSSAGPPPAWPRSSRPRRKPRLSPGICASRCWMCRACWPTSPGICRDAGVSIESMIQRGRGPGEPVAIVMITHETAQGAVERALKAIAASDKVRARPCMIPMEAA